MSTFLRAPYPKKKVTTVMPDPETEDSRASQSKLRVVRGATNKNVWTYADPSDKVDLRAVWIISRAKDEELKEFIRVYHTATWELEYTHEGTTKKWAVQLVGRPVRRLTRARHDDSNGEAVEVTLEFSAKALP